MKRNSLTTTGQGGRQVPQVIDSFDADYGYDYQGAGNAESQKVQISRVVSILRKYWPLIVGVTLLVTFSVLFYEYRKPDYFIASAKVQVNNETNPAAGGTIATNQGADPAYFATQLRILEGAGLLRRVVVSLDLEHNESFKNPRRQDLGAFQNLLRAVGLVEPVRASEATNTQTLRETTPQAEADFDRQAERLAPYVEMIKSGLEIEPIKDSRTTAKETRMIDVSFRHTDPSVAAKVANAIADIYVLQNLERKVESNATASTFLEKRVVELQNQIRTQEERLINYSKDNQILSLEPGQNTVVQRLADLNLKLGMAEAERISAEAAFLAMKQNPMSDLAAQTADPRTSGLESQLTALRQQLAQLKTEYTDEWPDVKRVQRQITQIEGELESNKRRAKDTQSSLLEQKYREALAKERDLRSNFSTQREAVLAQNEAAVNYRIIQQEIDSNRSLLANLLAKSRETDVILNGTPNNVLVADRATTPQNPNGPQRTKTILVAFIVSLFAAIGLAFAANWLDDSIRVFDDVEENVGLPVVGRIPGVKRGLLSRAVSSTRKLFGSDGISSRDQLSLERPIAVEAFNQVRASLLLSSDDERHRTVLVTSGEAGEGKTLTSFNLAKCLAQLGGRILLIDADLRRPQLHAINGIDNEEGLTRLLSSKKDFGENVSDAIVENVVANLDLMTAGPKVADPATLLSRGRLQELLEYLGTSYDHIIIDSPPILYFADSVLLATAVDSVLVVGRVNYSSSELLSLSTKKLQSVNANIVGVVLNDIPMKDYGYSRNNYYVDDAKASDLNGDGDGRMLGIG